MCCSPQPPYHLHLQFFRLVCFSNFLINGKALHLTGLCLICCRVTIFSLGCCPPLFHNFQQFNVSVAVAHNAIIQKKVDELLAKGAVEPSFGAAGFYSSVFVVTEYIGCLWPILNLKHFNCYMHIPSFKISTIRHVWQFIQHGDYSFSINLQGAYLHIPIVKHHHHLLRFVWDNVPY